jgi:hypothetical protein
MKSTERRGEEYSRVRKASLLSRAMSMPPKRDTKDRPNTATPGARFCILKSVIPADAGIFLLSAYSSTKIKSGNSSPKNRFSLSRSVSFMFLSAKRIIPPRLPKPAPRRRPQSFPSRQAFSARRLCPGPVSCPPTLLQSGPTGPRPPRGSGW